MQEREVTAGQSTYPLPNPFFTIATQNPIEQEGTYPLPEAQLDRFMFNIKVDYPSAAEEEQILAATTRQEKPEVSKVLSRAGDSQFAEAGRLGGGERAHYQVRGGAGAGDAAEGRVGAEVRAGAGRLGRGAAGRTVSDPRRQSARGDGRAVQRVDRRRAEGRRARAAPSHQHELPSAGRRHDDRRRDRAAAERDSGAGDSEVLGVKQMIHHGDTESTEKNRRSRSIRVIAI